MAAAMAVQVTMYLTEGDSWHHQPLHLAILHYLREENVAGAVVLHSVAGFLGRSKVRTAHLVEAGGDLPVDRDVRGHRRAREPRAAEAARDGRASPDRARERGDRAGQPGLTRTDEHRQRR